MTERQEQRFMELGTRRRTPKEEKIFQALQLLQEASIAYEAAELIYKAQ